MAIYTVHEPVHASDDVTRADVTAFIREAFTFWGFLFGPLFLLWHRLWLALLAWILVVAAIGGLAFALHVSPLACAILLGLLHVFLGVEGNDLRRGGLARRGFRLADVVSGSERAFAELTFFSRREDAVTGEARGPANWAAMPDPTPTVIGMFPEGGRS